MLLLQSISNTCNWKPAICLSFVPNPKEKLKASTRLIQIQYRRIKQHMCVIYQNHRKKLGLTYEEVMKTGQCKCYTQSQKAFLHYLQKKKYYVKSS